MKKSTLIVVFGMLILAACTKESDQLELHYSPKTGVASEAPFEVYAPQAEAYVELEEGLLEYLGREATASSCEVTKGIWLWETAMNYWFPSVEFDQANAFVADYDEEIIDERTIEMNLSGGAFETSLLRTEFITTYEDVERRVLDGLEHVVTDVQFVDLQGDVITLKVKSIYYLNPLFSLNSGGPQVDPAVYPKMAGYAQFCSIGATTGCWKDAQKRIKKVLPKPRYVKWYGLTANVYSFDTYLTIAHNRYIDGTYLPGRPNAILPHHKPAQGSFGISSLTCMLPPEQDVYAQAMVNQISTMIGKQQYWDGIAYLRVDENNIGLTNECAWGYQVNLATHYTYPSTHQKLSPKSVI